VTARIGRVDVLRRTIMRYPTTLAAAALTAAAVSSLAGLPPSAGALGGAGPSGPGAATSLAATPDERPGRVLGRLSTDGGPPVWADLTSGPRRTGGGGGGGGEPHWPSASDSVSAGPECIYQCIVSGIAYEHGNGVKLVVKTSVPADITLIVCRDDDGDAFSCEYHAIEWSDPDVTEFEWVIDPLPAGTYWVTAVATDSTGSSHGFGEFTLT
jgi:hypothetical protein